MKNRININGTLMTTPPAQGWAGRGFRYGDGLFETIRLEGGRMPLLRYHVARLQRGLAYLGMTDGARYAEAWMEEQVAVLAGDRGTGRVRLIVSRAGEGTYGPTADHSRFVLEYQPQAFSATGWRGPDLRVGISQRLRMPTHALSNCKTTSALAYVQAARERRAAGWDEILLLNWHGRVSEGGYTNVFVRHDGNWRTPPPTEGGVSGVMRAYLLDRAAARGVSILEAPVTVAALRNAEAIACTNAVNGAHAVTDLEGRAYAAAPVAELLRGL